MRQALAWTPDQRFLLFVRGDRSLWRTPVVGGEAERIGPHTGGITVHPDGKRIAFSSVGERGASKVWALEDLLPVASQKR
jgi:Tol biopolymer transport system component